MIPELLLMKSELTPSGVSKAKSCHDHTGGGGVSQANLAHDVSRDRDPAAKPKSQSQNDHTKGGH